jgi:hypothetical protein
VDKKESEKIMKNAQIWKLPNSHRPIVKIEYTIYELQRSTLLESDAQGLWNGCRAPKGAKMLAIIKVPHNDAKSALWALKKWTGT